MVDYRSSDSDWSPLHGHDHRRILHRKVVAYVPWARLLCSLLLQGPPEGLPMMYHVLERHDIIRRSKGFGEIFSRIFSEEVYPSIDIIGLKEIP